MTTETDNDTDIRINMTETRREAIENIKAEIGPRQFKALLVIGVLDEDDSEANQDRPTVFIASSETPHKALALMVSASKGFGYASDAIREAVEQVEARERGEEAKPDA